MLLFDSFYFQFASHSTISKFLNVSEDVTDSPIDYEELITCRSPISSLRLDHSSEIEDNCEKDDDLEESEQLEEETRTVKPSLIIKPDPDQQDVEIQSHSLDISVIKKEILEER